MAWWSRKFSEKMWCDSHNMGRLLASVLYCGFKWTNCDVSGKWEWAVPGLKFTTSKMPLITIHGIIVIHGTGIIVMRELCIHTKGERPEVFEKYMYTSLRTGTQTSSYMLWSTPYYLPNRDLSSKKTKRHGSPFLDQYIGLKTKEAVILVHSFLSRR